MCIHDKNGLNIPDVIKYMTETKSLKGYPKADAITSEEILALECDILAPCALDGAIHVGNAAKIKTRMIIEGANGPCTMEASKMLIEKGVIIVPDILANGGGVIVSYFEWVQGLQWFFWNETEVNNKMKQIITTAFDKVWDMKIEKKIDMRTAAMAQAIRRLEQAMLLRGLYPR